jgi:cytochrome P450
LSDPSTGVLSGQRLGDYFRVMIADRRNQPGDDLISYLVSQGHGGQPLKDSYIISACSLLLVAGIDTTWSSIGSALLHLATHPGDRRRLVANPALLPIAIEELLRAYSPVTTARIVTDDVVIAGQTLQPGDRVLLPFPAANRDPDIFPDADDVQLGRTQNRMSRSSRHPPLCRIQSGPHGDAGGTGGMARPHP